MATVRQHNWLGGQRIDVPALRDIEAGGAGDWDLFAGKIIAGELGIVVSGFEILSSSTSGQADELQLVVDGALVIHPLATESGSIFNVPAGTANDILNSSNPKIVGSFIADTTNYIGIDLIRSEDDSTSDTTQFYNPDTGEEVSEDVPQARTLDYRIYISTNDFSATPGLLPVAKVVTGPTNDASEVSDCRWMLGRLGSGGSNPDTQAAYAWPGGRSETGDASSFTEGDRKINDLKSILDSLRSRIWEIGGGEYWYSPTADRNVKMIRTGSPFASTGDWFEWVGSNLHWQGLKVLFDNSTVSHNDIADQTVNSAGLTDLADGECIYVDLDRTAVVSLQPQKAALSTLGTPTVPGSRWILAWRYGSNTYTRESTFNVGMTSPVATTSAVGTVKLAYTAGAPAAPVVYPQNANGQLVADQATSNANASLKAQGFNGVGVAGGTALQVIGGSSTSTLSGSAIVATVAASSIGNNTIISTGGATVAASNGGAAFQGTGGNATSAQAGSAFTGQGGDATSGTGGTGVNATGGSSSGAGNAGKGATFRGGQIQGTNVGGGIGADVTGGPSSNAVTAGTALNATGGNNSNTGLAGKGATITAGTRSSSGAGQVAATITGGNANTSGLGGDGLQVTGGTGAGASNRGGTALNATAGDNGGQAGLFTKSATDVSTATTLDATGVTIAKGASGSLNIAPALKYTTSNGDETNHFTHLGFPTAQTSKFLEGWEYGTTITGGGIWTATQAGAGGGSGGAIALNNPDNGYGASYVGLSATSGSAGELGSSRAETTRPLFPWPDWKAKGCLQAEVPIGTANIFGYPDANVEIWVGFTDTPGTPDTGAANTAMFRYKGGTDTTSIAAYTSNSGGGSATTLTGTTFSTTNAVDQVLKIEMYGSTTERGVCVVFSVDGVEKTVKTTNMPGTAMKFVVLVKAKTGVTTQRFLYVGNVEIYWTPMGLTTLKR